MKRNILFLSLAIAILSLSSCSMNNKGEGDDYVSYVDQYIGTAGHGHVFMGANVPFGLVQLGPTSIPQTWDWTSGYNYADTTVIGFSHTHLSGTGIGDLADVTLMPVVGRPKYARGNEKDGTSGLWSYFSRKNEKCHPGFYATHLDRYNIDVELTATERVGFHKYTFPASEDAAVVIDLENGTCWDSPTDAVITKVDSVTLEGYRFSKGWADNQKIYFAVKFSRPFDRFELYSRDTVQKKIVYGRADFKTQKGETIYVKVALSPTSEKMAFANMDAELPRWDFKGCIAEAREKWNGQFSKIKIEAADSVKKIFYTSLYHTMIAPSLFCDDGSAHKDYTTFSLWDTYRAAMPLMTLIHPEMMSDMVNTMLDIYEKQGRLPVWPLMGCETDCMVGNPAVPVVADAIMKGYGGFNIDSAYIAMKNTQMLDRAGLGLLKKYGYIPSDMYNESVSTCMEYSVADACLSKVASMLGKKDDAGYFLNRSHAWRKYFDHSVGFVRGLLADGSRWPDFNPFTANHAHSDFTEGNAWQYTWMAPQDVPGLIEMFGSKAKFESKLDSLFIVNGDMGKNVAPDIAGMIGQYAHGNEPSHHVAYLYDMDGNRNKTCEKTREIITSMYTAQPDGLSGNEDVGQMSAWYVLSAMGIYQADPSETKFWFGSPLVDKAVMKVRGGKTFTIKAINNSPENILIKKVTLNGRDYDKNYIGFKDIVAGGELDFYMGR
ncbi:MAG: GH92 family glycosyl hydrolase [Bacteroidales bacterium]|jgi:predicted alpha-1,2-mannosidase|nr:GH92 family glycosyl hydrolase [Bacteroidales bacterium]